MAGPSIKLSFPLARLASAIVTGLVFYGMVYLFSGAVMEILGVERVTIDQARWLYVVVLSSVPAFAAHGASTTFPDAYALKVFELPPSAAGVPARPTTINPWHHVLQQGAIVGLPAAAVAFWWISRSWPTAGEAPVEVVAWLSNWSGLLAAATIYARTGRVFLSEAAVPTVRRRYPGDVKTYVWRRHVIPQFIINAWFNAWVAPALVRGPWADPTSALVRDDILAEAGVTGSLLVLGVAIGTWGYVSFDLRWGVMPRVEMCMPNGWVFSALVCAGTICSWFLLYGVLLGLGVERASTWELVFWRAVLYGVFAGAVAYWSALWTLVKLDPSQSRIELPAPIVYPSAEASSQPEPTS